MQAARNYLPIVASALGNKYGVRVQLVNSIEAKTDGDTIVLPNLMGNLDPDVVNLLRGFLDHEAAHIRYTDFSVPITDMINALEDVRVEALMMERFPGCRKNLEQVIASYLIPETPAVPQPDWELANVVAGYLSFHLRDRLSGFSLLRPLAKGWGEAIRCRVGKTVFDQLNELAENGFRAAKNTHDVRDLAKQIESLLGQRNSSEVSPVSSQQGDGSGRSNPDQKEGENGGQVLSRQKDASQASQEDGESQSTEGAGEGGDANGNAGQQAEGGNTSANETGQSVAPDKDQGKAGEDGDVTAGDAGQGPSRQEEASQTLEAPGLGAGGGGDDDASSDPRETQTFSDLGKILRDRLIDNLGFYGQEFGPVERPKKSQSVQLDDWTKNALATSEKMASLLRQQLLTHFQERAWSRDGLRATGVRLNTQYLPRLKTGNTRVFRGREIRRNPSAAIYIVLDRSGSMIGDIKIARHVCYAICAAMTGTWQTEQLVTKAVAFPKLKLLFDSTRERYPDPSVFMHGLGANGSTPLHLPLNWIAVDAQVDEAVRSRRKRVAIVITDGKPDLYDSAQKAIRNAAESGVKSCGIGIRVRPTLFEHNCSISRIEELPGELVRTIRQVL